MVITMCQSTTKPCAYSGGCSTVYPKKYAHGFVVLCFVVVMQSFIMNSHEVFIHIHQGCFARHNIYIYIYIYIYIMIGTVVFVLDRIIKLQEPISLTITTQIRWKFLLPVLPPSINIPQPTFAHATYSAKTCHVQNILEIALPYFGHTQSEI